MTKNREPNETVKLGKWPSVLEAMWMLDPASIADDRYEVPKEYDELARGVIARKVAGKSTSEIVGWLGGVLLNDWGVTLDSGRAERVLGNALDEKDG